MPQAQAMPHPDGLQVQVGRGARPGTILSQPVTTHCPTSGKPLPSLDFCLPFSEMGTAFLLPQRAQLGEKKMLLIWRAWEIEVHVPGFYNSVF